MNPIFNRQTIYNFTPQPVPDEAISACLKAAILAPNHRLTQPWRFFILGKTSQKALAQVYAQMRAEKKAQKGADFNQAWSKAYKRFMGFPQVVLVGQAIDKDEIDLEDYAAVVCAIENFMLCAWEKGLGVQWSSGPLLQSKILTQITGCAPNKMHWVGLFYIGYPAGDIPPRPARKPLSEVVTYLS